MSGNIKVVCRFRPQNSKEKAKGAHEIINLSADGTTITVQGQSNHTFNFDKIWGPSATQSQVYDYAARPVVEDLFKGYNGTIFVYGQTGSGKTHTMQGPDIHDDEMKGVIPRMIETIFDFVGEASETMEFLVKVSYIEIYMEKIRDLLAPDKSDLRIRENKDKSVYIEGVVEEYVTCAEDVIRVMDTGSANRKVAATNMNDVSSRSHSIFIWNVEQKNLQNGGTMNGKLYLVDLAGSEKVGKTGASGQTLDEAKGINKSLSALGNVINALTDGKSKHVPYRDSKLTRILQESLGGNSRTTLVINCSPSSYNEEETLSTLRFGIRAKTIKNSAKVNKEMSVQELKALLDKATQEIARLKTYVTCLEEELRLVKGDVTITVKSPAPGAKGTPVAAVKQQATASVLSPDTRSKLPNVAAIQQKCTELEDKMSSLEEEKASILEKQDFLQDQLRDKEQELNNELEKIEKLKEELGSAVATQEQYEKENQIMVGKIAEMTIQMEKLHYEKSESQLVIESLMEQKEALQKDVGHLQKELSELLEAHKKLSSSANKKEEARQSKMALLEESQKQYLMDSEKLSKSLESDVVRLEQIETSLAPGPMDEQGEKPTERETKYLSKIEELEKRLSEIQQQNKELAAEKDNMRTKLEHLEKEKLVYRIDELEAEKEKMNIRIGELEVEKESVRHGGNKEGTKAHKKDEEICVEVTGLDYLDDLVVDMGHVDSSSSSVPVPGEAAPEGVESFEMEMLRAEMQQHSDEAQKMTMEYERLKRDMEAMKENYEKQIRALETERDDERSSQNEDKRKQLEQELNDLRNKTAKTLSEFNQLKTSLLRDLQNRCEKVIDLEMLLDEAREQYEQLLKNSSNKSLQKRNTFLERNLEQLTRVHQQLVNQNNELRLEKKVSEKKLAARNERIRGLEVLLTSAQEKLQQQAESHAQASAKYKQIIEEQKVKLEQANAKRNRASSLTSHGARIVKPIRGGGGRKKPENQASSSSTNDSPTLMRRSTPASEVTTTTTTTPGSGASFASSSSSSSSSNKRASMSALGSANGRRSASPILSSAGDLSNNNNNNGTNESFALSSNLKASGAGAAPHGSASPYKAPGAHATTTIAPSDS